jgi:hypothetical protein
MKHKLAKFISGMACDLDHFKNILPTPLKAAAAACVEALHDVAQALLGDDVGKVYAADDMGIPS